MSKETWKIWDKDDSVEQRTYKRVTGELPEMECTKQLVSLVSEVYLPSMSILDVGCAAGHYYNGLKKIDAEIKYHGFDATKAYIDFATKHFEDNKNTKFQIADIFELPKNYTQYFDIVFCANVILHLPSMEIPLQNLLGMTRKHLFIRTLISDKTHLSRLLYSDSYDEHGQPTDFVYQNTYSYNYVKKIISAYGNYKVEFIDDIFDSSQINKEHKAYDAVQSAVTRVENGVQIAGSKVFEWQWIKITLGSDEKV